MKNVEMSKYLKAMCFGIPFAFLLQSCGGGSTESGSDEMEQDTVMESESEDEGEKTVFYVTPSVVEIAAVIKSTEAEFSSDVLNPIENKKNYTTQHKRAVNMGVFGADLAYAAMYEETQTALDYLKTIKDMTSEMGMDGVFEAALIEKIESNITNRDSLLNIISDFFWSADAYLEDNDRGEVAAVMVAGGWVEATYISTGMAMNSPENQSIRDRIAEQKLIINNLIMLMKGKIPADNTEGQALLEKVKSVQAILKNVGVKQTTGTVVSDQENQSTEIVNSSEISMTEEDLKVLHERISSIRTELVQ